MAEFVNKEVKYIDIGEPISFENKTESPFTVSAGLIFHKDGEYHVSVHDNRIVVLNKQPTVDIQPIRHGKWRYYKGILTCSECGTMFYDDITEYFGDDVPRYCPECGAKMGENHGTD